jgi:ABC-2 type transport system ATP-binding protein
MIETRSLSKTFPTRKGPIAAVQGLDLDVAPGEIYGLLGPNGAGKTTTVRMLAGLIRPTEGDALIDGVSALAEPERVRRMIGVVPGESGHHEHLTADEELEYFGALYGLSRKEVARRSGPLLERLELGDRRTHRLRTYSKGMRQKVQLVRALLHEPRVLLLDEPTSGLDPAVAEEVWDLLKDLTADRGVTVVLCSHHLEEVERLCDRVGILRSRLLVHGSVAELSGGAHVHHVTLASPAEPFLAVARAAAGVVGLLTVEMEGAAQDLVPPLVHALSQAGAPIVALEAAKFDLRDLYRDATEETQ